MLAIALAFAASVVWGLSDFVAGAYAKRISTAAVVSLMVVGGLGIAALAALAFGGPWPGFAPLWPAALAGLASVVALATLYKALSVEPMSIVAPISAAYPVVPVIVGLTLGERPHLLQAIGMVLALVGVVLLASGLGKQGRTRARRGSLALPVVSALASGTMVTALHAAAVASDPYWSLLCARCVSVLIMLMFLCVQRPPLDVRPLDVPMLVGIGSLDTAATGLFAVASTLGYLSLISVVASLFPVTTVILARFVLGERLRAGQALGLVGALVGIALIAAN